LPISVIGLIDRIGHWMIDLLRSKQINPAAVLPAVTPASYVTERAGVGDIPQIS
jgi:hypothetical protein